jgi:hypothetical protein
MASFQTGKEPVAPPAELARSKLYIHTYRLIILQALYENKGKRGKRG